MDEPNLMIAMLKMGALFIILAGALVFVLHMLRRFNLLKTGSGKENLIHIIATHHITSKKLIALIYVCGELLLVGISEQGISFLTKIKNKEVIEQILNRKSEDKAPYPFTSCLNSVSQRLVKGRDILHLLVPGYSFPVKTTIHDGQGAAGSGQGSDGG